MDQICFSYIGRRSPRDHSRQIILFQRRRFFKVYLSHNKPHPWRLTISAKLYSILITYFLHSYINWHRPLVAMFLTDRICVRNCCKRPSSGHFCRIIFNSDKCFPSRRILKSTLSFPISHAQAAIFMTDKIRFSSFVECHQMIMITK